MDDYKPNFGSSSVSERLVHPMTFSTYEADENANVRVETQDGITGLFTYEGVWIEGELRHADALMCRWTAFPRRVELLNQQKAKGNGAPR